MIWFKELVDGGRKLIGLRSKESDIYLNRGRRGEEEEKEKVWAMDERLGLGVQSIITGLNIGWR